MNTSKKMLFRVSGLIILLAAIIFGYSEFRQLQRYETTDDAQVDGDVNPVIPKVGGYVKAIKFTDNQLVKEGDTLVVLDDADYKIRVAQAEAALQSAMASTGVIRSNVGVATATVQSSQISVQTARDNVATAQANVAAAEARFRQAAKDFSRYERLLAEKTVPQQQFDAIQATRDAAEAQLKAAQAQLQTAQSQVKAAGSQTTVTNSQRQAAGEQISVAQATIKQRQADLDMAKLQLSYTVVRASASGVVSKRAVQVGQLVQPGQSLCAIVNDAAVWVTANFKETQLAHMEAGQPVDIDVDAFDGAKVMGRVGSFAGATGSKFSLLPPDNATGNYVKVVQRIPVRIQLDKNSPLVAKLRPGMSVNVAVDIEGKH